jgi:hypothetical protein
VDFGRELVHESPALYGPPTRLSRTKRKLAKTLSRVI